MLISIVIPIYNVEAYLRECLNSVMAQTCPDWECILIDDASTDGSRAIAAEFCAADPRFRLICHPENRGLSEARNSGLDAAHGDYVAFIDSDDYVTPDFLEGCVKNIRDADIVVAGTIGCKCSEATYSGREALLRMLYQNSELTSSAWGRLYNIHLFDSLRFTPGRTYEDLDLIDRLTLRASKVKCIARPAYFYRQRPGSILHTWNRKRLDVLTITEEIENRLQADPELVRAARARRFAANFNIFLLLRKNGQKNSPEARACRAQLHRLRRGVLFDRRARLKDRVGALAAYFI